MKKLISVLLVVVMCFALTSVVFADDETAAEAVVDAEAAPEEEVQEAPAAEETEAPAAVKTAQGVSDVSNIIGIVVAVIVGAGAIVAIVLLAPKKTVQKKK